jgi:DNA polymerase III epsilon subunit-like protein
MHSATRNFFSVPSRRRAAQTIRYHRFEAFDAWQMAACIAWKFLCMGLSRHDKVNVTTPYDLPIKHIHNEGKQESLQKLIGHGSRILDDALKPDAAFRCHYLGTNELICKQWHVLKCADWRQRTGIEMAEQFDMFSEQATASSSIVLPPAKSEKHAARMSEEDMVQHLSETGRYRILEKLVPREIASFVRPEYPLKGIILDTETTGLSARTDEIIEIGMIAFTFDATGGIGDVTGVFGGLRQPSVAIPEDITRLTGIMDDMVAGQSIDMAAMQAMIDPADLIIAHNAGFDRPFCEAFSPIFSKKAWACSNSEIDWSGRGYEGTKLGYLIGQAGYFHDGHRAVDDCFALLEVLAREGDGFASTAFKELYDASLRSRVRIFAENSPFEMKDHLKARGYRWSDGGDGRPKSWWTEVSEEALNGELHYLRTEVYRYSDAGPLIKHLTAFDRFRS